MSLPASQRETPPPAGFSRFNFAAFLADMVSYFGGLALLSPVTILPLYATHLTDNPLVIALIPALNSFGVIVPQVLGARLVAHRTTYRPFVVRWAFVERASLLGAVIAMASLAHARPLLLLWGPLACIFGWWGAMGVNSPAYTAMLGHAIPPERRGRLFGMGAAMGGVVGFMFAWIARGLLRALVFPYGFVACTAIAFVVLSAGFSPLAFVRERPGPPLDEEIPVRGRTWAILKRDGPFRVYLFSQALFAFQAMPTAIWTSYALRRFHAGAGDIAVLTAVMAIAGGAGFLLTGWLADHYGNRAVILVSTALAALATLATWAAPTMPVYIATFVPAMLASSGWQLTSFNILIEFAPPGQVPAYAAVNAVTVGPFRVAAPLLGGFLVTEMGRHAPVFLAGACAAALSALALLYVTEPRRRPVG